MLYSLSDEGISQRRRWPLSDRLLDRGTTQEVRIVKKSGIFLFVAAFVLGWGAGSAEALRCGNKVIHPGLSSAQVVDACGEPVSVEQKVTNVPAMVDGADTSWSLLCNWRKRCGPLISVAAA